MDMIVGEACEKHYPRSNYRSFLSALCGYEVMYVTTGGVGCATFLTGAGGGGRLIASEDRMVFINNISRGGDL